MPKGPRKGTKKRTPTTNPAPAPPTSKTKSVPPQPLQSYQDPDEDVTMEAEESHTSLVAPPTASVANSPTNSGLNTPPPPPPRQQGITPNYFEGLDSPSNNPQTTRDIWADLRIPKRRRTGSFENSVGPPTPGSHREVNSPLDAPNALGLSLDHLGPPRNNPQNVGLILPPPGQPRTAPAQSQSQLPYETPGTFVDSPMTDRVPTLPLTTPFRMPFLRTPSYNIPDADVTGFLGDNPMAGMDLIMRAEWKELPHPKALVYPHDASYSPDQKGSIAEQIKKAITKHLSTGSFVVTAPVAPKSQQDGKKPAHNRRPWCYLVSGLSEDDTDQICSDAFISNEHATIHVLRFDPPPLPLRRQDPQLDVRS